MFAMKLENVVQAIVDIELRRNQDPSKGLLVSFDVGMADYSTGSNYPEERGAVHLLYYVKPGGNYISVFSAFSKRHTSIKELDWKHEVTHDSCWRDINIFSKVFFDFAQSLNTKLAKMGLPPKAPKDFSENVFFDGFSDPWKMIDVEVTNDPSDNRSYRRILKIK